MQKAYISLIKFALASGHVISVYDGEEWAVKKSSAYKAIKEAVESVEEAELTIRNASGENLGWALVSAFGLEPDETVIDNTMTDFMKAFDAQYY